MSMPPKLVQKTVDVSKIKFTYDKSLNRKERHHKDALLKAQQKIDVKNKPVEVEEGDQAHDKFSLKNIQIRPETPDAGTDLGLLSRRTDKAEIESDDRRQRAVLLLQRLIKGRAIQNLMFEGKEKRLDLIQELRLTEEWRQEAEVEEEKQLVQNYQERVLDGVAEALQADVISKTMDNLSKELVRFKQERRIAAMVHMAEQDRRRREAEESGRRQAEQILSQREDVLYRELMNVHQGSVDNYLQNIVSNAIDNTSSLQAYGEAKLKVQRLNKMLDKMEEKRNKPETIVKDLVASFLLPDVQRKKVQRQGNFCFLTPL